MNKVSSLNEVKITRQNLDFKGKNHLKEEKSPYLQQHANNPVWWYPWGDQAFEAAKQQNKIIFLSVGYSTCHWCHVMEHESFENQDVANVLNKNFISIKVDREERPDVDAIYMSAVQSITGRGGWPMSVWLLPDRTPFYGGTYFPKPHFVDILNKINQVWIETPEQLKNSSKQILALLKQAEEREGVGTKKDITQDILKSFLRYHENRFDEESGGFGPAPKFPQTMNLQALMRISRRLKNNSQKQNVKKMVLHTLDKMSLVGMFDHVGGGFHRYATDSKWLVPHFEKMLYDNALLVHTYLDAYQLYQNEEHERVIRETLDYILSDMTLKEGGFYSAEDADSLVPEKKEKEEGYFYTFTKKELSTLLTQQELEKVSEVFGVTAGGNFEGRTILNYQKDFNRKIKQNDFIKSALEKIKTFRNKRPRPHLDHKIVVSWNGLMISAMARAGAVLSEEKYKTAAKRAASFIEKNLIVEKKLKRRWVQGESKVNAFATDYAAFINGLLWVYQVDFDHHWLDLAIQLQEKLDHDFWDEKRGGGYFQDDGKDSTLLVRMKDDYDGVRPTASSLGALNLLMLHDFTYNKEYLQQAEKIFMAFSNVIKRASPALPQMVIALDYYLDTSKEVAVVGSKEHKLTQGYLDYLNSEFLPNKVIAWGLPDEKRQSKVPLLKGKVLKRDKPAVYVCEGRVCNRPVNEIADLVKQFQKIDFID